MSTRAWAPLGARVAVVPDDPPTHIGQIALPQQNSMRPVSGRIVEWGPLAPEVFRQEGLRVIFGRFAGSLVKISGERFLLMESGEIMAFVDPAAPVEADHAAALPV